MKGNYVMRVKEQTTPISQAFSYRPSEKSERLEQEISKFDLNPSLGLEQDTKSNLRSFVNLLILINSEQKKDLVAFRAMQRHAAIRATETDIAMSRRHDGITLNQDLLSAGVSLIGSSEQEKCASELTKCQTKKDVWLGFRAVDDWYSFSNGARRLVSSSLDIVKSTTEGQAQINHELNSFGEGAQSALSKDVSELDRSMSDADRVYSALTRMETKIAQSLMQFV